MLNKAILTLHLTKSTTKEDRTEWQLAENDVKAIEQTTKVFENLINSLIKSTNESKIVLDIKFSNCHSKSSVDKIFTLKSNKADIKQENFETIALAISSRIDTLINKYQKIEKSLGSSIHDVNIEVNKQSKDEHSGNAYFVNNNTEKKFLYELIDALHKLPTTFSTLRVTCNTNNKIITYADTQYAHEVTAEDNKIKNQEIGNQTNENHDSNQHLLICESRPKPTFSKPDNTVEAVIKVNSVTDSSQKASVLFSEEFKLMFSCSSLEVSFDSKFRNMLLESQISGHPLIVTLELSYQKKHGINKIHSGKILSCKFLDKEVYLKQLHLYNAT